MITKFAFAVLAVAFTSPLAHAELDQCTKAKLTLHVVRLEYYATGKKLEQAMKSDLPAVSYPFLGEAKIEADAVDKALAGISKDIDRRLQWTNEAFVTLVQPNLNPKA